MPFDNGPQTELGKKIHDGLAIVLIGFIALGFMFAIFLAVQNCREVKQVGIQCSAICSQGRWERYAYSYREDSSGALIPKLQCYCEP